jgi:hypothetical protein
LKIKKTLETEAGGVTFEGEVNQEELDLILSTGLNYLFRQGALPFKVVDDADAATLVDGSESAQ